MDKKKSVCKSLTLFYSFLRDVVVSKRRFQATKTRKDNDMCTHTHTFLYGAISSRPLSLAFQSIF